MSVCGSHVLMIGSIVVNVHSDDCICGRICFELCYLFLYACHPKPKACEAGGRDDARHFTEAQTGGRSFHRPQSSFGFRAHGFKKAQAFESRDFRGLGLQEDWRIFAQFGGKFSAERRAQKSFTRCQLVSLTGYDHVDLEACRQRGAWSLAISFRSFRVEAAGVRSIGPC